jgi:threonine/homoserine/homoserine lactone efflux protein
VVDLRSLNLAGYGQLAAATVILIPAITLCYAGLAARLRGVMASAKARKRINRTAAVVMAGAGLGVAVS